MDVLMQKHLIILSKTEGVITNPMNLQKTLDQLKDGRYKVEVSSFNQRGNQQNRYYWQMLTNYVQPALYDAGWREIKTKDDAHLFVADLFLKKAMVNEETGEAKERIRSTTELTKAEFNVYLEEIWQWAAAYLDCVIPAPNEQFTLYEETINH